MTDTFRKQGLMLALASIVSVGLALWALARYDVFATAEDVNIVVEPCLVRWVVAIVVGLVVPQCIVAIARACGVDTVCDRLARFFRDCEAMPQRVDEIHAAVCGPHVEKSGNREGT